MCLAVPGKVLEIHSNIEPVTGTVDFGGIRKNVSLELVPEVKVGEYVVVHVGFAISIVDEEDAMETLKLFEQMGEKLEDESSG
ncbi:MAG: HypC/HybG/HupF family hydrogenase formation chaperone [Bacteroidota bacterium]